MSGRAGPGALAIELVIVSGLLELINAKEEKTLFSQTYEGFWGAWRGTVGKIMVFCQFCRKLLSCSLPHSGAGLRLRWPSGSGLPRPQSSRPDRMCRSWFQGWGQGGKREGSNYIWTLLFLCNLNTIVVLLVPKTLLCYCLSFSRLTVCPKGSPCLFPELTQGWEKHTSSWSTCWEPSLTACLSHLI